MAVNKEACIYSHGGPDVGTNTAVPGTAPGRGRTIEITDAADCPPLIVKNVGSAAVTFRIVFNASPLVGSTFNPDPALWINANATADITLAAGEGDAYSLRTQIPYWATQIVSLDPGGELVSFVRNMFDRTRKWINAKYPDKQSVQTEF